MATPREREFERDGVALDATCRCDGERWAARITNISASGCGVELPGKLVARGDRLVIELDGDHVLIATVAWAGTRRAGLAFTSPLYGAMVAEFAEQNAGERAIAPRRPAPLPLPAAPHR